MSNDTETEHPELRLARYLKEFVGLRTKTVRDVDKYDTVVWFGDMPQDKDCRSGAWTDDWSPNEPWLEVKKQVFKPKPEPPEITRPWVNEQALERATPEIPPLLQTIHMEDNEVVLLEGESPPLVERNIADYPDVRSAYEKYRPKWEAWSQEHRRRQTIQKVYAELFNLHTQVRKQGEIKEVCLGIGLLNWPTQQNGPSVQIKRHTVVASVELKFDATRSVIQVEPPGEGAELRIEDDMLEADLRPEHNHYEVLKEQLDEIDNNVWDKEQICTALQAWAASFSPNMQWLPSLNKENSRVSGPTISLAPALILRSRPQTGMVRVYDKLIEQLSDSSEEIPMGWRKLTNDLMSEDIGSGSNHDIWNSPTSISLPPSEVFFPLSANNEQKRIVEAIENNRGVLVQGPPGTGKSQTIANLICHLLATGKRVVVTAETPRALRVLKEKLPKEIQPLCVSLLGQGGDAFAELNSVVQDITTRYNSYSKGNYDVRIDEIVQELKEANQKLSKTASELRSLREGETTSQTVSGGTYLGTASIIAKRVSEEKELYGWLKLPREASEEPAISREEIISWLEIKRRYTDEQINQSKLQIPLPENLLTPSAFSEIVEKEKEAASNLEKEAALQNHKAYTPLRAQTPDARSELENDLRELKLQAEILERKKWLRNVIRDYLTGQPAQWETIIKLSRDRLQESKTKLTKLSGRSVTIPNDLNPRKVRADAEAVLSYLRAGGKRKKWGLFTPKLLRERSYLKERVLVDGIGSEDIEHLYAVCDHLDANFALEKLRSVWSDIDAVPVSEDRDLCIAAFEEQLLALEQSSKFAVACLRIGQKMAAAIPSIPSPDWLDGDIEHWLRLIAVVEIEEHYIKAVHSVDSTTQAVNNLNDIQNAHPVVQTLIHAVNERDVRAYSKCYDQVRDIVQTRIEHEKQISIERILREAVPYLVESIVSTINDNAWDERFANWEKAWRWGIADAWLDKRLDFDYQEELGQNWHTIEQQIRKLTADLAALRAWRHFFDRLSQQEAEALKGWRETIRAIGRGTGRSNRLARLRREARIYMDKCRDAIPAWIMPRYLVAEMLNPEPNRFDLVIADEASQLGIESLFLFYIAKKILVVGDDQQISPYGVGIRDDQISSLQQRFLGGIPHRIAFSAQSSLYSNAKIRFNSNIVLREHFRCMPEIIQFSNDLCYASNGTPLDPIRAYQGNRLEPLVLRHVSEGYREGSPQRAINRPEANAIVAQVAACIKDPRYQGLTMGVISLQGEAQAKLIEQALLEELELEEIDERLLICGDAYAFQGDERNVIFLSMVAAPGETRIGTLSNDSARQRFNVAASRAMDQLWLFHTAQLDVLSPQCMRYKLLQYVHDPTRQPNLHENLSFDSNFERDVFDEITERGFHVRTQVGVGDTTNHRYRIDLVVEGMQGRLAVECDGEQWHGPDRYEQDMARQRDLERAGWQFVRVRGGDFYRNKRQALDPLWTELEGLGIRPGGIELKAAEPPAPLPIEPRIPPPADYPDEKAPETTDLKPEKSIPSPFYPGLNETELKVSTQSDVPDEKIEIQFENFPAPYVNFEGVAGPDPRYTNPSQVAEGLCRIIKDEGPVLAKRTYDIYLRGCGIKRMGGELKKVMNRSLQHAIRNKLIIKEDESSKGGLLYSIVRLPDVSPVVVRERGTREFNEIPPSELQLVARRLLEDRIDDIKHGSEDHLRIVLDFYDLRRLTTSVGVRLLEILERQFPYVDEMLNGDETPLP